MPENVLESERAQFVIFCLDGAEFGVPIGQVVRIVRLVEITRVPRAPNFLEGVINLQGEIVPVIDLKKRFGLENGTEYGDKARILIVEVPDDEGRQLVGMLVDAVTEIRWLPASAVGAPPPMVAGISPAYLAGVGQVDDRLVVILDLDRVLCTEEMVALSEAAETADDETG